MTAADLAGAATADAPTPPAPERKPPGRIGWRRWALRALLALLLVLGLLVAGARIGIRTEPGRAWLTRALDGLALGPAGRLHIEGLAGDPLHDFTVRRLQIADVRGVWLDGRDLALRWDLPALFGRRFHAERLAAGLIRVLRAPEVAPQPPSKGPSNLPLAIQLDALHVGLETLPAFSVRHGAWDIDGGVRLERNFAATGQVSARSRLHAGDGLDAQFQLGDRGRIHLRADAVEAGGGALAGALGLPADRHLSLQARADGAAEAGTLRVATASGGVAPLTATASWAGGASRLWAHLDLTASRLTRFVADRAGPAADLTVNARHVSGDVFQIQAALTAKAAALDLGGPVDWKKLHATGLGARLQVADVSRWAPAVGLGPARIEGRLDGGIDRFDFRGVLDAQRFAQDGYTLARIAGPVQVQRQGQSRRLQADLTGQGGAGSGPAFALLGQAPHAKVDASLLPDGRVLVRQLDAEGAGMKVTATGGQGLLGDLSFKGTAQVSNLAVIKPGARGVLDADWIASQARGQPWRFVLNAAASRLALGVAQADHFVGATPKLAVKAAYGAAGLDVDSAQFTGANLTATARGRLDPKGGLGFGLDWQAKGPFDTGPLEIAGAASGSGRITGTLAAPKADLEAELASLALGRLTIAPAHLGLTLDKAGATLGGAVSLTGPSAYGPASLKAGFQLAGGGVDVHDLALDAGGVRASGALALRDGAPSTADLTVQARKGAFLDGGQLDGVVKLAAAGQGLNAHIALDGANVAAAGAPVLRTLHLHADGPWSRLPFQLAVDAVAPPNPFSFSGSGVLDQGGSERQLTLSGGGQVRKVEVKTLQPAVLHFGDKGRDLALHLSVGGAGRADVQLRQDAQAVAGHARLTGVSLTALNSDYVGAVNADLDVSGHGSALSGALNAALSGARSRDAPTDLALNGEIKAVLSGARLNVSADATNAQGLKSALQVDLPAEAASAPFRIAIDRTKPISGRFSADGELRPLWDLLVGGEQTLAGRVTAQGTLGGTLNAPRATGAAALANGRLTDASTGLNLQALTLKADFDQDQVRVGQASGADGHGGTMSGSGDIGLAKGGGSSFKLHLANFRMIDNDLARASVSGDISVTRAASGAAKVAGALKVDRADISAGVSQASNGVIAMDVREVNLPGAAAGAPAAAPVRNAAAAPVALDVAIRAPRGIFVKGKGLNVELSLNAHVTGSLAAPDLTGTANVVLGSYDFAGKKFDFDSRGSVKLATSPDRIRLDLTATRDTTTLTAVVKVSGTAARPEIQLSSTPVLPQDEVLSQVLFGSSAAQLSGAQAAELASALASLSGGGGFDVLGRLRQFAGLDRLALGQGTSGTGVSGGKYVTDSVYVELTGGGREGPSASVEWRVLKNLSLISQVGTQGDAQLSVQFRHNYR